MDATTLKEALANIDEAYMEIIRKPEFKEELKICLGALNEEIAGDPSKLTPAPSRIFEAFKLCPWKDLKVIILGQDPYPTKGNAHGLSFSVEHGVAIPRSLKKIYECLINQGFLAEMPSHGNLAGWARQGILMLNASLSTRVGVSQAHAHIWGRYTSMLLGAICEKKKEEGEDIIVLAWGRSAQEKAPRGSNVRNLEWGHPSPMSAYNRDPNNPKNFIHCDNFKECNRLLEGANKTPIDWTP